MLLILTFCTAITCEETRTPLRDPAAAIPFNCALKAQEFAAQEARLHEGTVAKWRCVRPQEGR